MSRSNEGPDLDLLVRGGISDPAHLLEQATECLELKGFMAVSCWGLPGDTVEDAVGRLPGNNPKIRVVQRRKLIEFGYELRDRHDGHTSIMLPSLTLDACRELSDMFDPPMARPQRPGA